MALGSVERLLGFQFVLCALICCCYFSVGTGDSEEWELGSFARTQAVRGRSEADQRVILEDIYALLEFKKGVTHDPIGALSGWKNPALYCSWHGVQCAAMGGNLKRVVGLQLPSNRLGGSISPRISELSELRHLDLSNNSFSGFIPPELCRLRHLQTLSLSMNKLSSFFNGVFVRDYGKRLKITRHGTSETSGCASGPFHELQVLDLSNNFLTGALSEKMGQYSNLREVKLGNNILMGAIPASLGSLRFLSILSLENNMLDHSIPAQLSNCRRLQYFDARNNLLSGKVPAEILQLPYLRYLNLTSNPFDQFSPSGHGWLDRKENSFAKSALTSVRNLVSRLPSNFFTFGYFPASKQSRWLAGSAIQSPSLSSPSPAPATAPMSSKSNASPSPAPLSAYKKDRHTGRKWALGVIIGFISGVASGLTFCLIVRMIRSYWKKTSKPGGPAIFHPHIQPKDLAFLESEEGLLSQSDLLGKGASGQVFKAFLRNGMLVAIKRIPVRVVPPEEALPQPPAEPRTTPDMAQVRAELETLGKIRHRNLVLLLAYVLRPDAHLLIYQFMMNGSLHDILNKVREGSFELKWLDRYRIAVSVASGLKYLHYDCSPRILHRDIKPSNILLDEQMEAHLGDFGLARLIPDDKSHITTGWAGTVGYIPPEYQHTCRFTEAGDVYGFGITLAGLLTGREPTETFGDEYGGSIMGWMRHHLQAGTIKDILDPKMGELSLEEVGNIELMVKIALFCTSSNVSDRPTSKDILVMLEQIHGTRDLSGLLTMNMSDDQYLNA